MSRKEKLDVASSDVMACLMSNRMKDDASFFYQLILPICDPKKSDIENDNRIPYFTMAVICTNIYAAGMMAGSGVGHDWSSVSAPELLRWTAC